MILHRITIFLAVSRHLSYTKAANELYISQPAVSKQIQELEQELEVQLFNRKGNRIELTPAGELLRSYGTDIQRLVQNLKYDLAEMNNKMLGHMHIGASSTISQYIIPSVIAAFKETHPEIDISLASGNTAEINAKLRDNHIDLGITEGDRRLNTFVYQPFIEDEIAFIRHNKDGASLPNDLTTEELQKVPLVIREPGSGTREVFEQAIRNAGLSLSDLNIRITLGSTEAIKSYLLDSTSAGVFSVHAIRSDERARYHISRLQDHPILRTFQFVLQQGSEHKLVNEFIRFGKRHYNRTL